MSMLPIRSEGAALAQLRILQSRKDALVALQDDRMVDDDPSSLKSVMENWLERQWPTAQYKLPWEA